MTLSHADGETEGTRPGAVWAGGPGPWGVGHSSRGHPASQGLSGKDLQSLRQAGCLGASPEPALRPHRCPSSQDTAALLCWCRSSAQRGPREQGLC